MSLSNNNPLHRSSPRRRSSVIDIVTSKINEEDITKSLLAAKTPNIISKRRGSAVSIESNSRRSSIVMIDSITTSSNTSSSSSTALLREITTTTFISEMILTQPMNTDEFITKSFDFSSSSKMHYPPPPPPPDSFSSDDDDRDIIEDIMEDELEVDEIFSDDDFKRVRNYNRNKRNGKTLSQYVQQQQQQQHHSHHSRSLSTPPVIPSFSQRPLIPSLNYDNHNEYKQRTITSSKKLTNFFGDKPPIDICVREIEKEGLKAMLHSKIPLCYFLYSLLEEYSCENLFFFLEVEQYESFDFVNSTQQYTTAQHIFDTYLTRNSQFEVNVDDKVRKSVIASIKSQRNPRQCFDDAKRAIFVLLEVSFARFIRSQTADLMRQEIGETTTYYPDKAREAAVSILFRYLEKQNGASFFTLKPARSFVISTQPTTGVKDIDVISPLPSPSLSVSRKRNDLIRSMIYEFLRTLLEIDVNHFYYEHFRNNKNKSSEKINESLNSNNNNNSSSGGSNNDDEFDIWSNDDECIEMVKTDYRKRDQLKKKQFKRPTISKPRRKMKGN